jgi:methylthioribulose-1-phosphate dehydratase
MRREEAGRILAREAARFAARGWMMGTSGNLSVRVRPDGGGFYITASGRDKGELLEDDVAMAGPDGRAELEAGHPHAAPPSAEAGLHARIYRLRDAGAVFHVHTVAAVRMAERHLADGAVRMEGLEMLKGIGRAAEGDVVRLPIIENHQDMRVLGDRLEAALDPRVPGMLVARHGLYAWGRDAVQARHHVEILQWLLEYLTTA